MLSIKELLAESEQCITSAEVFTDLENELVMQTTERLPEEIIDAHSHCCLKNAVDSIELRAYNHIISTFLTYPLPVAHRFDSLFFPQKQYRALRFSQIFRGVNYKMVNRYLLDNNTKSDRVALFGAAEDPEYVIAELRSGKYPALKMYYLHNQTTATKIQEVFPPSVLAVAESLDIPIILHLPKPLADSIDDVLNLKQGFPDLRATICHLGLSEVDNSKLHSSFAKVASETDFMMDTSMCNRRESIELALSTLGPHRLMYGTDAPYNLLRSVLYIHPQKGGRVVTKHYYHWADPLEHAEYGHLADGAIHAHWRPLINLLDTIERQYNSNSMSIKKLIFADKAREFYNFD